MIASLCRTQSAHLSGVKPPTSFAWTSAPRSMKLAREVEHLPGARPMERGTPAALEVVVHTSPGLEQRASDRLLLPETRLLERRLHAPVAADRVDVRVGAEEKTGDVEVTAKARLMERRALPWRRTAVGSRAGGEEPLDDPRVAEASRVMDRGMTGRVVGVRARGLDLSSDPDAAVKDGPRSSATS